MSREIYVFRFGFLLVFRGVVFLFGDGDCEELGFKVYFDISLMFRFVYNYGK